MIRTSLFAIALVTLAGCATSTSEEVASGSTSELTAAECPGEVEGPVTVTLDEVSGLRCRAIKGMFMEMQFRGKRFSSYVSDDHAACDAALDALRRASWDQHGLRGYLVERCHSESGHPVVESDLILNDTWHFRSWD